MKRQTTTSRIVVGVDASDESDVALREGLRTLAAFPGAELHLVHAARPHVIPPVAMGQSSGYRTSQEHAEMLRSLPEKYWDKAVRLAREERVVPQTDEIDVHVRVGSAPDVILQVAEEVGADLVVVGCHGRSGLQRAVLGSVAERVVRDADCPVLVARPGTYERPRQAPEPPPPDTRPTHDLQSESPSEEFSYRTRRRVQWVRDNPDTAGLVS